MPGIFFNGQNRITPAVVSAVDDSALLAQGSDVGNVLCVIGSAAAGQPNTALRFGSAAEARDALVSGPLVDAITRAFDPSAETGGPSVVVAIRVDPATQSTLALKDGGGNTVINLTSNDYGLRTGQVRAKIENASVSGFKLTTALASTVYTQDNVHRNLLQIQYLGAQTTATMSVTGTTLTLNAPAGTPVAAIDLATYATVQQLVDRINAISGFSATVQDGNGAQATLQAMDGISAQDVKTAAVTATANLQAVIDWFNSNDGTMVSATRAVGALNPPAVIPFTYLAGGTDGTITNTQWSNAYTTLQYEDVQWVVPLSSDPSIAAMNDAHCAFMSTTAQLERRGFVGTALGTSDAQAILAAKALNSDRTALTHLGMFDYNDAGVLTLYPPYIVAAMIGGLFAGVSPGEPGTNKSLKLRGIERKLRNPVDTDILIVGGVLCVESAADGYRIVKSITTWLNDTKYNRVEVSTGAAVDYLARSVRDALKTLKGRRGDPSLLALGYSITETTLKALAQPPPLGPGVIVGDAASPAFRNIQVSLNGDATVVRFQASPVIPNNFVEIEISAVPYSGTTSA